MQKHQGTNPVTYLKERDREIATVEREREALDRTLAGLKAARDAMASFVLDGAVQPRSHGQGPRAAILREILESRTGPMPVDDIMAELKKRDVIAERPNVSATLAYLKRKGVAKNVERGQWASVTSIAA